MSCNPSQIEGFKLTDCIFLGRDTDNTIALYSSPAVLINTLVRNLFIIAGLILFFTIIYAGFKFIQGDKEVDEAKTILTVALKGFAIMFVAFWIVTIIQYLVGFDILNPDAGLN